MVSALCMVSNAGPITGWLEFDLWLNRKQGMVMSVFKKQLNVGHLKNEMVKEEFVTAIEGILCGNTQDAYKLFICL